MSTETKERDLAIKAFGALEIKDAEQGVVTAVVATLSVVDRDREVILPGALQNGAKVKLSAYGHGAMFGDAPVGKGVITVEGDKAVFKGNFFMTTTRGIEAFRTIKELGTEQEWSFGFRVLESSDPDDAWRAKGAVKILKKIAAFEVSPVIIGAGIDTGTVAVKEADAEAEAQAAAEAAATQAESEAAAAKAAQLAADELNQSAVEEFERFQRTSRRIGG